MKGYESLQAKILCLVISIFILSVQGCTYFDSVDDESPAALVPESQPFYPEDFKEILLPDGLEPDMEESMYAKSETFKGGILNFQGRIEITSLTKFFENTMPQKGWQLAGSVKSSQSLLIFTKPEKTCMIIIKDSKLGVNTEVYIYISEQHSGNI